MLKHNDFSKDGCQSPRARAESPMALKKSWGSERRVKVALAFGGYWQNSYVCNTWHVIQGGYKFFAKV